MVGGMGDQHRHRRAGRRQGLLPQIGPGFHVAPMDPSASGRPEAIADRDLISPSIGCIQRAVDHPAGKRATARWSFVKGGPPLPWPSAGLGGGLQHGAHHGGLGTDEETHAVACKKPWKSGQREGKAFAPSWRLFTFFTSPSGRDSEPSRNDLFSGRSTKASSDAMGSPGWGTAFILVRNRRHKPRRMRSPKICLSPSRWAASHSVGSAKLRRAPLWPFSSF